MTRRPKVRKLILHTVDALWPLTSHLSDTLSKIKPRKKARGAVKAAEKAAAGAAERTVAPLKKRTALWRKKLRGKMPVRQTLRHKTLGRLFCRRKPVLKIHIQLREKLPSTPALLAKQAKLAKAKIRK